MKVLGYLLAGTALTIGIGFSFLAPGCLATMGPKTGRIIDHNTGEGVPGAVVVISGIYRQLGAYENVYFCTYAEMTKTDAQGFYHFPNEYSRWKFGLPKDKPENLWILYVSKNGYIAADTKWPLEHDVNGTLTPSFRTWISTAHTTQRVGLDIQIPPIELMQVNLPLKERILYFANTGLGKTCRADDATYADMKREVREFYAAVSQEICAAPKIDAFDSYPLFYLALYADKPQSFYTAWRALDPRWQEHLTPSQSTIYEMGNVCKIARAGQNR